MNSTVGKYVQSGDRPRAKRQRETNNRRSLWTQCVGHHNGCATATSKPAQLSQSPDFEVPDLNPTPADPGLVRTQRGKESTTLTKYNHAEATRIAEEFLKELMVVPVDNTPPPSEKWRQRPKRHLYLCTGCDFKCTKWPFLPGQPILCPSCGSKNSIRRGDTPVEPVKSPNIFKPVANILKLNDSQRRKRDDAIKQQRCEARALG